MNINALAFYGLFSLILITLGNTLNLIPFIDNNDILAWCSVVIMMPLFLTQLFGLSFTPLVCIAVLRSELEIFLEAKLNRQDIHGLTELISKANKSLAFLLFPQFSILQFFTVVCVYLSVTDLQQAPNIFLLANMMIFVYKVLTDLEECYDLIYEISRYFYIISFIFDIYIHAFRTLKNLAK